MAPLLFTVPGLGWEIQGYGLFMGLALVVGWIVALTLARADRLPTDTIGTAYVASVAAGLFAARGAWLVQHPTAWTGPKSLLSLSADGLAPFAGAVAALSVGAVLVNRRRIPVTAWFDIAAPAVVVGAALERIGALLAGTGYGRYAPEWPLSIRFPVGSPAFLDHQRTLAGLLPPGADASLPVHPTQLYGIVLAGLSLVVALQLRKRRRFAGQVFLATVMVFLAGRIFVEEWFRADAVQAVFGPFNPGQVAAFALLVALGLILRTRARRAVTTKGGLRYWEGGRWSPDGDQPGPSPSPKPKAKSGGKTKGSAAKRRKSGQRR